MKYMARRQLFKTYTLVGFFTTLISTVLLTGFAYAKKPNVSAPAPDSHVPKEKPVTDVVKPVPSQDYSIKIPDVERIEGVAWDEGKKNLLVLDSERKKIHWIDPISGTVTQSVKLDQKNLKGLAFDGKALWVADEEQRTLIKIDPEDGKAEKPINMEVPADKGFDSIEGITWDREAKALWVAIYAGYSSSFNLIDPEKGKIRRSVFADCHPRGIATDGEYLWSICYNDKKFPSKIDKRKIHDKEFEMFHSRTFVEDIPKEVEPNGLAFDDIHLWYADRDTKTVVRFTPPDVQEKSAIPPVKGK